MSLFNFGKKKKPEAPGDDFLAAAAKDYKATEKRLAAKEKRQLQIEECSAVLRDCRATFQKSIAVENALAGEMRRKGYDTAKQRTRVREAAIGILVVDQALFELQSINSEADLNSAMNKMGMALRQMKRVDNNTAAISGSTQRIVEKWYPGALSQEIEAEDGAEMPSMEVPEVERSKIDNTFVENLMNGDSFEIAMFKHNMAPPPAAAATAATRTNRDDILAQVRAAVDQEPDSGEDYSDIIAMNSGKF